MKKISSKDKTQLRDSIKRDRITWTSTYLANIESKIISLFLKFYNGLEDNQNLAVYNAMPGEISVSSLLEASSLNNRVCLPCVEDNAPILRFRRYYDLNRLVKGKFSIFQPDSTAEVMIPQCILVPCLACDKQGTRLGYGAGYYDRTLAALRKTNNIITIGICADEHFFESLPKEDHDQNMDYVITESRIHKVLQAITKKYL